MPKLKRRHFLQLSGATLATLGFHQLDLLQQTDRAFAQSTGQKYALLVGINEYPLSIGPLSGCVTDVQLQQELLQYRYGFPANHIKTLTDAQATRKNIVQAFEQHLIAQAKPGDVVVFHFSGHGARVDDQPDCDAQATGQSTECLNSSLVPYDGESRIEQGRAIVNDITGHTLFLLMAALQTENVTVILDSCHSGGGTRGNFVARSVRRNLGETHYPSSQDRADQKRLLAKTGLSRSEYIQRRRMGVARGIVIASAQPEQLAVDARFSDFAAGAFTYTLTRYLWQQSRSPGLDNDLVRINLSTKTEAYTKGIDQDPLAEYAPAQSNLKERPFLQQNPSTPAAEAVVLAVSSQQFTCWLGGMSPHSLPNFPEAQSSLFTVLDAQGNPKGEVKLESRWQLTAKGTVLNGQIHPGDFLQEKVHAIALQQPLTIGIDQSLASDTTAIQAALSQLDYVQAIAPGQGGQYLLGTMTADYRQFLEQRKLDQLPPVGSIGLFSPGLNNIVRQSFGDTSTESAAQAVQRLQNRFTALRMAELLKQMLNPSTSQLAVDVAVTTVEGTVTKRAGQAVAAAGTRARGRQPGIGLDKQTRGNAEFWQSVSNTTTVNTGHRLLLKVKNDEAVPLYIAVLVIESSGELLVLFPFNWDSPTDAALVQAGEELTIPGPSSPFELVFEPPTGWVEVLVLCSANDLRFALKGLHQLAQQQGLSRGEPLVVKPNEAEAAIETLVSQFGQTRGLRVRRKTNELPAQKVAALSVALQVVQ